MGWFLCFRLWKLQLYWSSSRTKEDNFIWDKNFHHVAEGRGHLSDIGIQSNIGIRPSSEENYCRVASPIISFGIRRQMLAVFASVSLLVWEARIAIALYIKLPDSIQTARQLFCPSRWDLQRCERSHWREQCRKAKESAW